jgi:hypothetical protein
VTDTYDKINHWYGWNGGECPVHPETVVDVIERTADGTFAHSKEWKAEMFCWTDPDIIAFRITRLYVEPKVPREWWVNVYPDDLDGCSYTTREKADQEHASNRIECVHVREVLEPTQ